MTIGHMKLMPGLILSGILLVILSVLVVITLLWRYKDRSGIKHLIILMVLTVFYSVPYGFELLADSFEMKVFWGKMTYLGGAFLPVSFYLFTHLFSQRKLNITRKHIYLLSVIPALTLILSFTNELHHFYWTKVDYFRDTTLVNYTHGPGFWVYYIFCQALIAGGLINLLVALVRFPKMYASHVIFILVSALLPTIANLIYVFGFNIAPGYDLTPPAFFISVVFISIGVLHLKMFDIVPIARNTLVDILTDGIVVINDKLIIEDFNPASRHFFLKPHQLRVGSKITDFVTDEAKRISSLDLKARQVVEHTFQAGNQQRTLEIELNPLFSANNEHSGNLILLRDITAQKDNVAKLEAMNEQLNKEIQTSEKLIDDLESFAHTVAHDIKSNLAGLVNGHDMIRELIQAKEFNEVEEISHLLRKTSLKTLHITQELLMLATLDQENIRVEPLNMHHLIQLAEDRLRDNYEPGSYFLQIDDNLPSSKGYGPWIEEVWYNYLTNGVKYGGMPAVLKIGGDRAENGKVRYWISDNGDGIDPENVCLLFNTFSRLRPERVEGTGLGLSIVKRIIDKLGGSVWVESSGVKGEGSTFYFTLPALLPQS